MWCQGEFLIWPVIKGAKLRGLLVRKLNNLEIKKYVKNRDKASKLTPDYAVGAKRILLSDKYYRAIGQNNVTLETSTISKIGKRSVETINGNKHDHDIIVYATGFHTNPFLKEINVVGKSGFTLKENWKDGAFAYLGVTTHKFPNMFMLYGPNTNTGHTSIIYKLEAQFEHILKLLSITDDGIIEVRGSVEKQYNVQAQKKLSRLAWSKIEASWYKDGGRVTNNWYGSSHEYNRRLRAPIIKNFIVTTPQIKQ